MTEAPQFLPSQVVDFYDPNSYFRDGAGSDRDLVDWIYSTRELPRETPRWGGFTPPEVLACELLHLGIPAERLSTEYSWLGLPPERLARCVEAARDHAAEITQHCLASVAHLRASRRDRALSLVSDITLAGAVLASNAHDGQTRLVGDRPYYTHVRDVALILRICHQTHLADDPNSRVELYEFEGLLHDALEDALPKDGGTFLTSDNVVVSPLVTALVLQRLGADADTAERTGRGLLALTKSVGADGRMFYDRYIQRFEQYPDVIPDKLADLQHNYKLDGKTPPTSEEDKTRMKNRKLYAKRLQYYDAQHNLLYVFNCSQDTMADRWLGRQLFAAKILTVTPDLLREARQITPWAGISPLEMVHTFQHVG